MSHFSKIATKITNKRLLLQALTELGISHEEGAVDVSGYEGAKTRCEVRIPTEAEGYDVGFRKKGDTYELIGDWFGLDDFDRKGFLQTLNQRYALCAVRDQLGADFSVVEERQDSDNSIRVLLRRMA
jgi:hypothetical protein